MNGFFVPYSGHAWLGGETLLLAGAICIAGGVLSLARHPVIGAFLACLGGILAGIIALLSRGTVAFLNVLVPGGDSYDVTMHFAPGVSFLLIGAALGVVGALIAFVAALALSESSENAPSLTAS